MYPYGMGQVFHQANFDCFIQTDASGSWGVVHSSSLTGFSILGLLNGLQLILWLKNWHPSSLAVPSGLHYSHTSKFFQCDNQSLVLAINKGSSKDSIVMHLLRCLWFIKASFDIHITATHLPGIHNNAAAYMLSRDQGEEFLATHP